MGWLEFSSASSSLVRKKLRIDLGREPTEQELVERMVAIKVKCQVLNDALPLENRRPDDPPEYDYNDRNDDGTPRLKR